MGDFRFRTATVRCPCCGYLTLHERGAYEICRLCWWEDDGQDDPHAEEVRGGPNGDVSLADARRNFRSHLTMYPRGGNTRAGGADSEAELHAKRSIMRALERLGHQPPASAHDAAWEEIETHEAALEAELQRKIAEYERQADDDPSV